MTEAATIARAAPAGAPAEPAPAPRYWAFLSYSHRDKAWAERLHGALETYRVPAHLVGRATENGIVPTRLHPIFRDRQELAASDDLGADIRAALAGSRYLLVLCSPAAAASRWTDAEIATFKRLRPEGCVLAAIVAGEPFASEAPGREAEECFPPALRRRFDRRGRPTAKRAEPIAADLRESGDGERMGRLKLIAGMLGVGLDELARRDAQRRQKRLTWLAAGSLAGMAVTSGLAVAAVQARNEARDQREQAEELVGFMLGDLRQKLEPLGRLDVLDSVGGRALGYYQTQDKASLSEAGLAQRSRALTLMGEIAQLRGDLDGASTRYREALAGTAEAINRAPDNPQRIFDHAQNVFWVGAIANQRGQTREAERRFTEYKRLAERLVALDSGRTEWQAEVLAADTNLGIVALEDGRFAQAAIAFEGALQKAEALVAAVPRDRAHRNSLQETLAYLADAQRKDGRLDEALASRERQLAVLSRMATDYGVSADLTRRAMVTRQALGNLFAERGEARAGLAQFRMAAAMADELRRIEPDNTEWLNVGAALQADYADLLLATNRAGDADPLIRQSCETARRLADRDASVVGWRFDRMGRCLQLRALASAARGYGGEAARFAEQAVALASRDTRAPRSRPLWGVSAQRLVGDQLAAAGRRADARETWTAALDAPYLKGDGPQHQFERYLLLERLGHSQADAAAARLDAIGFRHPRYVRARYG